MSTDLKPRSKAYSLTRFFGGDARGLCVQVTPTSYLNNNYKTFSIPEIAILFRGDFSPLKELGLLDETIAVLKVDLAEFALTAGDTMVAE